MLYLLSFLAGAVIVQLLHSIINYHKTQCQGCSKHCMINKHCKYIDIENFTNIDTDDLHDTLLAAMIYVVTRSTGRVDYIDSFARDIIKLVDNSDLTRGELLIILKYVANTFGILEDTDVQQNATM